MQESEIMCLLRARRGKPELWGLLASWHSIYLLYTGFSGEPPATTPTRVSMALVLAPAWSLYEACTIKLRGLHNSRQESRWWTTTKRLKVFLPVIRLTTSFRPAHVTSSIYSFSTLSRRVKVNKNLYNLTMALVESSTCVSCLHKQMPFIPFWSEVRSDQFGLPYQYFGLP